jgi:hypothetical protein
MRNNVRPSKNWISELIIDQLVAFLVVEHAHPGLSPQLATAARIFLDLFQDLTAPVVTS